LKALDFEPVADETGGDLRLEIREGQNEVWLQGQDPVDVGRGEGADAGLFAARLRGRTA